MQLGLIPSLHHHSSSPSLGSPVIANTYDFFSSLRLFFTQWAMSRGVRGVADATFATYAA